MNTYSVDQLSKALGQFLQEGRTPPVDQWRPSIHGSIDMHIDSQGHWFHEGGQFKRLELAKLFASILRVEESEYSLVTPQEQLSISVEDVPFVFDHIAFDESKLIFVDCLGLITQLDTPQNWELREYKGATVPYIHVRNGLWGRVSRNLFYELVSIAIDQQSSCNSDNSTKELFIKVNGLKLSLGQVDDD